MEQRAGTRAGRRGQQRPEGLTSDVTCNDGSRARSSYPPLPNQGRKSRNDGRWWAWWARSRDWQEQTCDRTADPGGESCCGLAALRTVSTDRGVHAHRASPTAPSTGSQGHGRRGVRTASTDEDSPEKTSVDDVVSGRMLALAREGSCHPPNPTQSRALTCTRGGRAHSRSRRFPGARWAPSGHDKPFPHQRTIMTTLSFGPTAVSAFVGPA